jgi:hypothetical protein
MKRSFFGILAALALIVGFSTVNSAFAKHGHENETKFTGVIESLPGSGLVGDWIVSGKTVHVTSSTSIEQEDGRVAVGATVKVEGRLRSDNSVDATEIEVTQGVAGAGDDGPTFKGTIESLPASGGLIGDWRVGGRTIHVSASTRIEAEDGPVALGAFVEIKATLRADGSMDATKIEVKSNVAGDDGRDEINGTIQSLPNTTGFIGDWTVSGRTVHVTAATIIDREHGSVAVGALVEVKGAVRIDGSIDATRIEVKTTNVEGQGTAVKGAIQSLPGTPDLFGDWIINNVVVHVTSSTRLKAEHGAFAVGTNVKAKGLTMADGSIVATKIQVRD